MSLRGAIMIQGAGSNVGKSLIVAGLCRLAARKGVRVAPFKPQNMSNNAAAAQGGEIGRAQALQARAAGIEAHIDMNPVLLKPESEQGSQVIVQGKRFATVRAHEYALLKVQLLGTALAGVGGQLHCRNHQSAIQRTSALHRLVVDIVTALLSSSLHCTGYWQSFLGPVPNLGFCANFGVLRS